ncbi:helix-turn-helix transcriptional regulator [Heyndrickxia coagulans]|uniref:helix-turn-helix domain-containing protein n=1 Tax=Heyndrickxia coagulans TaxID=1398 RepID=UPI002E2190E3|nr:helix-turn-helix transcriptional regulator [Heyndrickxia coagulans]
MNELSIGKCIIRKRKEKGITQEQLADYMGVSKASVSKWETGQSYPDIVILPKLAAYFNITVDELLGYEPQLSKAEIKKIYHRLSEKFSREPFEEAMEEVNQLVKEYCACFPFLLSIAQLVMNYANLAKTEEQKKEVYTLCIDLCRRVKEESEEIGELKTSNALEALSKIALGHYDQAVLLLKNSLAPYMGEDVLLIQAYQMRGEKDQAARAGKIFLFQNILSTLQLLVQNLAIEIQEPERFENTYRMAKHLIDDYELKSIGTNAVFTVHIVAAQGFIRHQQKEKALDALKQYAETVCSIQFPFKLRGNRYFTDIEQWLEEIGTIGTNSPRDDESIKTSFLSLVKENPVFAALREEKRYQKLVNDIEHKLGIGQA